MLWAEQSQVNGVVAGRKKGLLKIHPLEKALTLVAGPMPGSLPLTSSSLGVECRTSGETAGGGQYGGCARVQILVLCDPGQAAGAQSVSPHPKAT